AATAAVQLTEALATLAAAARAGAFGVGQDVLQLRAVKLVDLDLGAGDDDGPLVGRERLGLTALGRRRRARLVPLGDQVLLGVGHRAGEELLLHLGVGVVGGLVGVRWGIVAQPVLDLLRGLLQLRPELGGAAGGQAGDQAGDAHAE